jgi:hypothetical protein
VTVRVQQAPVSKPGPAKLHGPVSKTPVLPNLDAILVKPGPHYSLAAAPDKRGINCALVSHQGELGQLDAVYDRNPK